MMMWLGIHDGTAWWIVFAGIWMLIFWGPIIALVLWGVVNVPRDKDQPHGGKIPSDCPKSLLP
jgi:hypothetical protein